MAIPPLMGPAIRDTATRLTPAVMLCPMSIRIPRVVALLMDMKAHILPIRSPPMCILALTRPDQSGRGSTGQRSLGQDNSGQGNSDQEVPMAQRLAMFRSEVR